MTGQIEAVATELFIRNGYQLTRHASGFSRLDELLMWTITGLLEAYGGTARSAVAWPAIAGPGPKTSESRKIPPELASARSSQTLLKETT